MGGKSIKVTEQRPTAATDMLSSVVPAGVLVLRDVRCVTPSSAGGVGVVWGQRRGSLQGNVDEGPDGNDPGMPSCATEHAGHAAIAAKTRSTRRDAIILECPTATFEVTRIKRISCDYCISFPPGSTLGSSSWVHGDVSDKAHACAVYGTSAGTCTPPNLRWVDVEKFEK